jgi:hypothetical protein
MKTNSRRCLSCAIILCLVIGCQRSSRPETAAVSGVVTLDGTPLPGATVVFIPQQAAAKSSRAITDTAGHYELAYLRDIKGAVLGKHEVRITTRTEQRPVERLLPKYNSRSVLTADVVVGGVTKDFELKSQKSNDSADQ